MKEQTYELVIYVVKKEDGTLDSNLGKIPAEINNPYELGSLLLAIGQVILQNNITKMDMQ